MTYRTEFPDFPAQAFPAFPHPSFVDSSWHNDACPSMASEALGLHVWIDYPDQADREFEDCFAYVVVTGEPGEAVVLLETDDWKDVVAFVDAKIGG